MPIYQYRCRECGSTFDVNRPMSEANAPAPCPANHADTVKLLRMAGLAGTTTAPTGSGGGGCCGGGCCAN